MFGVNIIFGAFGEDDICKVGFLFVLYYAYTLYKYYQTLPLSLPKHVVIIY